MQEILTFEKFITQDVLIVIYYLGAISLPVLFFIYRQKAIKVVSKIEINKLFLVFILFLFLELMWRMMFEAMIGYFDMHNYLQVISHSLNNKS